MEIIIGTLALAFGLLVGMLLGWRIKPVHKEKRHLSCHMCNRTSPGALIRWQIRGSTMKVCNRCHPFYKHRFEKEIREDTHSFTGETEENL